MAQRRRKPQPSNVLRGYGKEHKRERALWAKRIALGGVSCTRCGYSIAPGMSWDLDHTHDRTGYLGPAHSYCNRSAGATKGNRRRGRPTTTARSSAPDFGGLPDPQPTNTVERWSMHWAGPFNPRCPDCRKLGRACPEV